MVHMMMVISDNIILETRRLRFESFLSERDLLQNEDGSDTGGVLLVQTSRRHTIIHRVTLLGRAPEAWSVKWSLSSPTPRLRDTIRCDAIAKMGSAASP